MDGRCLSRGADEGEAAEGEPGATGEPSAESAVDIVGPAGPGWADPVELVRAEFWAAPAGLGAGPGEKLRVDVDVDVEVPAPAEVVDDDRDGGRAVEPAANTAAGIGIPAAGRTE